MKLKHDEIWGWGIYDLNGWGIYSLDGWGSYGKVSYCYLGDMLKQNWSSGDYPFGPFDGDCDS